MYPATISLTDVTSSLCIDDVSVVDKTASSQVFVRQPSYGGLQIIQLEEEPAPPPRLLPSSSSLASSESESASGRSYWSSSYYSESRCSDDEDDEEELEDGEDMEEYCSSEEDMDDEEAMDVDGQKEMGSEMDGSRMKRILAWRADFYAQADASLSESSLLKRKFEEEDDEVSSQSSKRSRRSTASSASTSPSSLGMHACPACDTSFDTQHGLRQHGLDAAASTNEACCTAVEYEFE
ncbi:hypothetical protein BKA70DRAFT_1236308 [Coprinopsis sp. MPI-PUGE-AT-0042]|nr:hypothetical protein BKA70DRAFT_1236308 [Coprinopsis sp. MPI-PUGE-AT-0042]